MGRKKLILPFLGVLVLGLPVAIFALIQNQDIRQHASESTPFKEFYVSPQGSDTNLGTIPESPFKTITKARDTIRGLNTSMTGNIIVYLRGGTYDLTEPIKLTEQDSAKSPYTITYKNYQNEVPIINGGKQITGWVPDLQKPGVFKANVGTGLNTRQLFINGNRAIRARSTEGLPGGVKICNGTCTLFPEADNGIGYTTTDNLMRDWGNPTDIELVEKIQWAMYRCGIASMTPSGSVTSITMKDTCWKNRLRFSWISSNVPTWIENAYELLDQPGEWYYNKSTGYIYYKPLRGEIMQTAYAVIPIAESLLEGHGSIDKPLENITFEGITFQYGTWLAPNSNEGFTEAVKNHLNPDWDKRVPANITFTFAKGINLIKNNFLHLGATGIILGQGVQNTNITGNQIFDISATGIEVGDVQWQPTTDTRIQNDNIKVENNFIHKIGAEYYGGPGIITLNTKNSTLSHNEITDVSYDGISSGWWLLDKNPNYSENNKIQYNLVYDYMKQQFDGGGIYINAWQKNTLVSDNVVRDQFEWDKQSSSNQGNGGIYLDSGSRYYTITRNIVFHNKRTFFYNVAANDGSPVPLDTSITDNWWDAPTSLSIMFYKFTKGQVDPPTDNNLTYSNNHTIASLPEAPQSIISIAGIEPEFSAIKNTPPCIAINTCTTTAVTPTVISTPTVAPPTPTIAVQATPTPFVPTSTIAPTLPPGVRANTISTLFSSPNPSTFGQSISFISRVQPYTCTGSVSLFIDGAFNQSKVLSSGTVIYSMANLARGSHTVRTDYAGSSACNTSTSAITQQIN